MNAERAWTRSADEVIAALGADPERGLTAADAAARVETYGPNELLEGRRTPAWRVLLGQFTSPMILVLVAAAAITALIGDLKDTVVILAIVVVNGVIGFVQEYRAERAMEALRRMAAPTTRVVRDGSPSVRPAPELVPGDLVLLEAGDVVAADLRLTEIHALRINEAALTGESEAAEKTTDPLPEVTDALLADRRNTAFRGTAVVSGRGAGVVVATGMATEIGEVATLIQAHGSGPTPLQQRLSRLGGQLAVLALAVCAIVFVTGLLRGEPVDRMFLTAVSLAVAAIPEGLPAVITVALALGARRMAQRRALIRKLPAVETLGSVSVICSDKTGTLTQNRMVAERVWTPSGAYRVLGRGYEPGGTIEPEAEGDARAALADRDLAALAIVAALCNDATLHAPADPGGEWTATGDPTEAALLAVSGSLGASRGELLRRHPRLEEITFESGRRRMTTFHGDRDRDADGPLWVAVKGAPEAIAPLVHEAEADVVAAALAAAEAMASDGYRVLALAERRLDAMPEPLEEGERDLHLVGLVGMADPPREVAAEAIAACRAAGITPVMITGDHPLTAVAIARRIGILRDDDLALTGAELERLDDAAFAAQVERTAVYARTNPEQKVRIVEAWRTRGAVVAMTGDGVNDAPALRLADIGIAMGITGTEVSKEAADMVLADDDFATIVEAVREGRRIYDNIRRFLRYMLTTNSAEVWVMALAPFLGLPLPLLAVQILWINLVTDGLPALALGVEPGHENAMRRPPRRRGESILGEGLWTQAVRIGALMAAVVIAVQAAALANGWAWQTMVFTTLALLQLGNALAVRSTTQSVFRLGLGTNRPLLWAVIGGIVIQLALVYVPVLHGLFDTESLTTPELAVVLIASTAGFLAVEAEKWWRRRRT